MMRKNDSGGLSMPNPSGYGMTGGTGSLAGRGSSSLELAALYEAAGVPGAGLSAGAARSALYPSPSASGAAADPANSAVDAGRRKSHSSIVDACMADLMSRRRMAMAREAAAAAAMAATAARDAAARVASLEAGGGGHGQHDAAAAASAASSYAAAASPMASPMASYNRPSLASLADVQAIRAQQAARLGNLGSLGAHQQQARATAASGYDDPLAILREKEERLQVLREEQERRFRAKQRANADVAAAVSAAGVASPGPQGTASTGARRIPSSAPSAPDGWWVCETCKTRAFASEAECLDHQAACSGGDGGTTGSQARAGSSSVPASLGAATTYDEMLALETSVQRERAQAAHRAAAQARAAAAATAHEMQRQQQQQQQHAQSESSSAAAARAAVQNLELSQMARFAMREMARRGLAGQQQQQQQQTVDLTQDDKDDGDDDAAPPQTPIAPREQDQEKTSAGDDAEKKKKKTGTTASTATTEAPSSSKDSSGGGKTGKVGSKGETSGSTAAPNPDGYSDMPSPIPLGIPLDKDMLTPLHCFVREHCVQVFTATEADVNAPSKGKRRPILIGQVGIRCPHCRGGTAHHTANPTHHLTPHSQALQLQQHFGIPIHHGNSTGTERGSVYYPFTVASIYNATMNLLQRHLQYCPCVPPWIMDRYRDLKADDARSGTSKQYWIVSARKLGLVDTPEGIRFDPNLVESDTTDGRSNDFYSNRSNALPTNAGGGQQQQPRSLEAVAAALRGGADSMLRDRGVPFSLFSFGGAAAAPRPTPEQTLEATAASGSERLVVPDDEMLATSFSYHIMSQMQKCYFTEADRLGKRKALPVGFEGLACRHCFGGYGTGRFFPSTIKTLSDTSKTLNVLHNHMMRCRKCPPEVRDSLEKLKGRHDAERARMKFGSQKVFFERIWARLHPIVSSKSTKKPAPTTSAAPAAASAPLSSPNDEATPQQQQSPPPPTPSSPTKDVEALAVLAGMKKRKDRPDEEGAADAPPTTTTTPPTTTGGDDQPTKETQPTPEPTAASPEQTAAAIRKNMELEQQHADVGEPAAKRVKAT